MNFEENISKCFPIRASLSAILNVLGSDDTFSLFFRKHFNKEITLLKS
jgi:hypothetical protein